MSISELRAFRRYAVRLSGFLRETMTGDDARARIEARLRHREESFLSILEKGVFAKRRSPYRKLFEHAGLALADVAGMTRQHGVEGTLERLYDAGVYVTLEEFKGRRPIERPGLHIPVRPRDFDNPLLERHYEGQTSGSRGVSRRIPIDFDLLTHESAYFHYFLSAFDLWDRPVGLWRALPPSADGLNQAFRYSKLGRPIQRWFSHGELTLRTMGFKYALFTRYTVRASRGVGRPIPQPQYVPQHDARTVARWLAQRRQQGQPALLDTNPSSGVRVCRAASEHEEDISGTFFRFGGEPYTSAKARIVAAAGCRAAAHYSMAEAGNLGLACAAPSAVDEVHLLTDKIAVLERESRIGGGGPQVKALVYTTVLPSCPRIMLNVESDDFGVLKRRSCGCPLDQIGFDWHLHDVRSYEKLTSEGVAFLGTELLRLVEDVLPARFGGLPTDYQFVEEEIAGLPKVSLFVSPGVGPIDTEAVISTIDRTLREYPGGQGMAERWRGAGTLGVRRSRPHATASAKILPLHVERQGSDRTTEE
jgi:hypothetical protein